MALLPAEDREKILRGLMRMWSRYHDAVPVLVTDLEAAIGAADGWMDSNQSSYNQSLPEPVQSTLVVEQKVSILIAVTCMRVSEDYLRAIFGEVN